MTYIRKYSVILICIIAMMTFEAIAKENRQSVGLVLSGGGAKGIAHIGVIQALEDNDIPIDYITGTSMGAIVGGLYAAGYTPDEMIDLILSRGFSYWSTGRIDPKLTYYFNNPTASPAMFSTTISHKSAQKDSVASSIISGMPMSFAFMDLFSGYTASCRGDFDQLFVPFRCVASDVYAKQKYVFRSGNLGDAIRASMTFPIVFQPITVDGRLLYDGGIYDNFPVDVMRQDFAPSIMIGVDVSVSQSGPKTSLMDQLDNLVIQNKDHSLPDDSGIKMSINLNDFSLLDFAKAKEIYRIGYDHAIQMMDSIRTRITARTPAKTRQLRRNVFKSRQPYVRFDSIEVSGGNEHQNDYIAYLFRPHSEQDTIGIDHARDAYYQAISSGKLRELMPQATYNDSTGLFKLHLKASVKGRLKGSLGGYFSSSTSSYIYASVGYSSLSFSSMDANIESWIGQTEMAGVLNGRIFLHTTLPSAITATAVVSREKFYQSDHIFFDDKLPKFVVNNEYFGRIAWNCAAGRHGAIDLGVGYGRIRYSYYRNSNNIGGRLNSTDDLGQAFLRYNYTTLDNTNFPTAGNALSVTAMGLIGNNTTDSPIHNSYPTTTQPKWLQIELRSRNYPAITNHLTLGIESDILLSTRHILPTYNAAIASAPAFRPTPASHNTFRSNLRSNSFIAAGLVPVYKFNANMSARIGSYIFMPLRTLNENPTDGSAYYGRWFKEPELFSEADITYQFPFGSLTGYINYSTDTGSRWNVGLSFGIFILPPKFLR